MARFWRSSRCCVLLLVTVIAFVLYASFVNQGQVPMSQRVISGRPLDDLVHVVEVVQPGGKSGSTFELEEERSKVFKSVVLFAYQRGGSSFVGSVLHQLGNSFYWFEPLKGPLRDMYGEPMEGTESLPIQYSVWRNGSIRQPPLYEMRALSSEIGHIMTCNLSSLSTKTLGYHGYIHASPHLAPYYQCYRTEGLRREKYCTGIESDLCPNMAADYTSHEAYVCRQKLREAVNGNPSKLFESERLQSLRECQAKIWDIIKSCLPPIQSHCERSSIRVVKVIRTTMATIRQVLIKHPDTLVIHLLRDPRGILSSRMNLNFIRSNMKVDEEARDLCTAMLEDVRIRHQLEREFPDNFITLRYEDVAADPVKDAEIISAKLKINISQDIRNNLRNMVHGKTDNGAFGLSRVNGSGTAYAWKGMSAYILRIIDINCKNLYEAAGYLDVFDSAKRKSFIKQGFR